MNTTRDIVITTGDPAGVGPEVCVKWLRHYRATASERAESDSFRPLIFGDASVLRKLQACPGMADWHDVLDSLPILSWEEYQGSKSPVAGPVWVDHHLLDDDQLKPGEVTAHQGRAAYVYIERAIMQALAGRVAALVTGPIHKEAFRAAGVPYPGHTELLTDLTHAPSSVMMLTSPVITCSLVTAHVGLADVPKLLTVERVLETIRLTYHSLQRMLNREPRLTICGLNPHAGEGGLFGEQEEERFIQPATELAREEGISLRGPLPPDTAFVEKIRAVTDAYICMYHDQGLIPLKALDFNDAVNVTLGLPIVRTSVDHGTAFDIAWQGLASEQSLIRAVELANRLAR